MGWKRRRKIFRLQRGFKLHLMRIAHISNIGTKTANTCFLSKFIINSSSSTSSVSHNYREVHAECTAISIKLYVVTFSITKDTDSGGSDLNI